jgi:hypothetical protein
MVWLLLLLLAMMMMIWAIYWRCVVSQGDEECAAAGLFGFWWVGSGVAQQRQKTWNRDCDCCWFAALCLVMSSVLDAAALRMSRVGWLVGRRLPCSIPYAVARGGELFSPSAASRAATIAHDSAAVCVLSCAVYLLAILMIVWCATSAAIVSKLCRYLCMASVLYAA